MTCYLFHRRHWSFVSYYDHRGANLECRHCMKCGRVYGLLFN